MHPIFLVMAVHDGLGHILRLMTDIGNLLPRENPRDKGQMLTKKCGINERGKKQRSKENEEEK